MISPFTAFCHVANWCCLCLYSCEIRRGYEGANGIICMYVYLRNESLYFSCCSDVLVAPT
jgi:hypothetical protein